MHAPIALFAFNRPEHTARTLAALAATAEAIDTRLHVFVDGIRNSKDETAVAEVIRIANTASGFRSVEVVAADTNQGLYRSITHGVTRVVSAAKRVIVVEDDILVSPHFLAYMNEALARYELEPKIGSIHGYTPPISGLPDYFFLRGGDCWGWATWADRWALFDPDAQGLLHALVRRGELHAFSATHGIQGLRHLIRRSRNRNESWAAHWNASLFLQSRLTLHPGNSFVQNIGNDGSGTHSTLSEQYRTQLQEHFDSLPSIPIQHDTKAANMLRDFYDATIGLPLIGDTGQSLYLALLRAQAHVLSITQRHCHPDWKLEGKPTSHRGGARHD
jgi:hypothetical protein